jgi:hypothetical protein
MRLVDDFIGVCVCGVCVCRCVVSVQRVLQREQPAILCQVRSNACCASHVLWNNVKHTHTHTHLDVKNIAYTLSYA